LSEKFLLLGGSASYYAVIGLLIILIEYVQRFGDFSGFFTKKNGAEFTSAAGVADELLELEGQATSR